MDIKIFKIGWLFDKHYNTTMEERGSHQVPNVFPKMFLKIAPPLFIPYSLLKSCPPLFIYISLSIYRGGPKGWHVPMETSILWSLKSFNFFLWWANQNGSLQAKKKKDHGRHPLSYVSIKKYLKAKKEIMKIQIFHHAKK